MKPVRCLVRSQCTFVSHCHPTALSTVNTPAALALTAPAHSSMRAAATTLCALRELHYISLLAKPAIPHLSDRPRAPALDHIQSTHSGHSAHTHLSPPAWKVVPGHPACWTPRWKLANSRSAPAMSSLLLEDSSGSIELSSDACQHAAAGFLCTLWDAAYLFCLSVCL